MLRESGKEQSFANQVAEATGLAPMFANGVLDRCCKRAGIARPEMKPSDLEKILPHLESCLLVYKTGREVLAALDRLNRLGTKATTKSARHQDSFIRQRPASLTDHEPFALLRRTGSR